MDTYKIIKPCTIDNKLRVVGEVVTLARQSATASALTRFGQIELVPGAGLVDAALTAEPQRAGNPSAQYTGPDAGSPGHKVEGSEETKETTGAEGPGGDRTLAPGYTPAKSAAEVKAEARHDKAEAMAQVRPDSKSQQAHRGGRGY